MEPNEKEKALIAENEKRGHGILEEVRTELRRDSDFHADYRKALGLLAAARDGRGGEMWRRSVSTFLDEVGW